MRIYTNIQKHAISRPRNIMPQTVIVVGYPGIGTLVFARLLAVARNIHYLALVEISEDGPRDLESRYPSRSLTS
jgi:hypothetical protein